MYSAQRPFHGDCFKQTRVRFYYSREKYVIIVSTNSRVRLKMQLNFLLENKILLTKINARIFSSKIKTDLKSYVGFIKCDLVYLRTTLL